MKNEETAREIELLPCPFCGGEGADATAKATQGNTVTEGYYVSCIDCGNSNKGIFVGHESAELARERWNHRAYPDPDPRLEQARAEAILAALDDIEDIVGELMIDCPTCKGTGIGQTGPEPDYCAECGGPGEVYDEARAHQMQIDAIVNVLAPKEKP